MVDESIVALIERLDRRAADREAKSIERDAKLIERIDRRAAERDARIIERMKVSEQHFIEALSENSAELKSFGLKLEGSLGEIRDSMRANTNAVLFVLDRHDRLEGGTA